MTNFTISKPMIENNEIWQYLARLPMDRGIYLVQCIGGKSVACINQHQIIAAPD